MNGLEQARGRAEVRPGVQTFSCAAESRGEGGVAHCGDLPLLSSSQGGRPGSWVLAGDADSRPEVGEVPAPRKGSGSLSAGSPCSPSPAPTPSRGLGEPSASQRSVSTPAVGLWGAPSPSQGPGAGPLSLLSWPGGFFRSVRSGYASLRPGAASVGGRCTGPL